MSGHASKDLVGRKDGTLEIILFTATEYGLREGIRCYHTAQHFMLEVETKTRISVHKANFVRNPCISGDADNVSRFLLVINENVSESMEPEYHAYMLRLTDQYTPRLRVRLLSGNETWEKANQVDKRWSIRFT